MNDNNPYKHPLGSNSLYENLVWETQRIQWEVNNMQNHCVHVGAKVIFIVDKILVSVRREPRAYKIHKDSPATIIQVNPIILRLDRHIDAFRTTGLYCFYVGEQTTDDILPGYLKAIE